MHGTSLRVRTREPPEEDGHINPTLDYLVISCLGEEIPLGIDLLHKLFPEIERCYFLL